ncbi:hypothetical protein Cflav_PD4503 [Pedosphaera parvula Ellin514]|uniref:Uncharacterized protein n=1 Tax=Pedosphaera parvula (strain Ellin514) TaxID=320771 RepID=B9XDU9_PEDPL|nr:hypothetical protein Cflav_PD4503 [Pedosphaera parvula Ellin514]
MQVKREVTPTIRTIACEALNPTVMANFQSGKAGYELAFGGFRAAANMKRRLTTDGFHAGSLPLSNFSSTVLATAPPRVWTWSLS